MFTIAESRRPVRDHGLGVLNALLGGTKATDDEMLDFNLDGVVNAADHVTAALASPGL